MDATFAKEDLAFQEEVRNWIEDSYPQEMRARIARSPNHQLPREDIVYWHKKLYEKGWITPNWPVQYGGCDWRITQRYLFDLEMTRAGAPGVMGSGISLLGPVVMAYGSEEQKNTILPRIRRGDVWWCQGYSEPGAGSDLAALGLKAENKGDHYLVNGSKLWTTGAHNADWIFCLVRTGQMEKKQMGISFLLIDMSSPGVSVEPITTLDQGPPGFNEVNQVFFSDVEVPIDNRVGDEHKGWTYAKYLLEFERGNGQAPRLMSAMAKLKEIASAERADGRSLLDDPDFKRKIAETEIAISAMNYTDLRILSKLSAGENMGPESSLLKTRGTEIAQEITELTLEAVGQYAMPFNNPPPARGVNAEPIGPDYANVAPLRYFNNRKLSIFAGSNEIQRNIMAKLVLGL